MNDLKSSSGSVNQEYERYMDSTQAKVEQFKEKLGYKFAMKQIAKKPSKVVESSEMEIVDNTINSDAPYCGRFEKYRNKK